MWLGAVGRATSRVALGPAVTPPAQRYHPVLVAQGFGTLERMNPGRTFIGLGSGEALNEVPVGMDWPPPREKVERLAEALEIMHRLYDGERLEQDGRYFRLRGAQLHTRPERRPPFYVSAFGPKAAKLAGRLGDGLWTLADPERVPDLIDAYRGAAEDAGKQPGEIVLQVAVSWAPDDDEAFRGAEVWKGAQPNEFYTEDWHDPDAMIRHAREHVSDDDLKQAFVISSDPGVHAERIREVVKLGATIVSVMNVSGAAPLDSVRVYGEHILPALRGAHVS
jgi:coenzyme F420-dependent glucose-6-phosphate dehydrogenase